MIKGNLPSSALHAILDALQSKYSAHSAYYLGMIFINRFPARGGPFSIVFAELTDGTKRDLCHGSKRTVLSMRHGYLATETSRDAFST